MKISKVEAFAVRLPRDYGKTGGRAGRAQRLESGDGTYRWRSDYPALYSTEFETCLVQVTLNDGRVGWGEAQAPLAPEVAAQIVKSLLSVAIEGESFEPTQECIAKLWERMYSTMRVRGQTGGFMLDAIAGVDLALWHLAAHIQGGPLRNLLATSPRQRVPAYVSGTPGRTVEDRLAFTRDYYEDGFRIFKLYFENDWDLLIEQIDRMQEDFDGIEVAVDALWHLPAERAVECAQELAERRVLWLECPLPPEDLAGHVELVNESGVRLALGKSYRTTHEALPFFEKEILSYWQPDLGRSGITETLALAKLAKSAGIAIVPQVSIALPPQLNAAIECAAAIANCLLCEYNPRVVEMANRFLEAPGIEVRDGAYECSGIEFAGNRWESFVASLRAW